MSSMSNRSKIDLHQKNVQEYDVLGENDHLPKCFLHDLKFNPVFPTSPS